MKKLILILCVALGACCTTPQSFDIGREYLGVKYISDPLGEGESPDADPLIRTDAFDCTTFVETSLAGGDVQQLTQIRYRDGVIGFTNRNHFIESDWIPNNANRVQNVSAQFGQTAVRHVVIDKKSWFKRVHDTDVNVAPVATDLEYIPYCALGHINNDKPLIVLFIVGNCEKCDKIGTDIAVVHMGFLMPGGKILRHASSSAGHVVDVKFDEYVDMRRNMKNNIGITVLGIK